MAAGYVLSYLDRSLSAPQISHGAAVFDMSMQQPSLLTIRTAQTKAAFNADPYCRWRPHLLHAFSRTGKAQWCSQGLVARWQR
jgi:hypothetical protein